MKKLLFAAAFALAVPAMAQAQDCDRACLIKMADDYAAALVAHDPSRVPLTANAVTVENARKIGRGEGLWHSATGAMTEFQIHVPDPVSQQVGLMAMMEVDGKPALVGIRLKRVGGKIVEAEHMVAGNLSPGQIANLTTPRAGLLREVPESKWLLNSVLGMHGVNVGKIKQVLEDQKTLLNTPNPKDMSSDIQDRMNQIGRARTQLKAGYSQGRLRRAMPTASARSKLPQR